MTDNTEDKKKDEEEQSLGETEKIVSSTWASIMESLMQKLTENSEDSATNVDDDQTSSNVIIEGSSSTCVFSDLESMFIFCPQNQNGDKFASCFMDIHTLDCKRQKGIGSPSKNEYLSERTVSSYSTKTHNNTPNGSTHTKISEHENNEATSNLDNATDIDKKVTINHEYSSVQTCLLPKSVDSRNIPISLSQRTCEKELEFGNEVAAKDAHTSNSNVNLPPNDVSSLVASNENLEDEIMDIEEQQTTTDPGNEITEDASNTGENSGEDSNLANNPDLEQNFVPIIVHVPHNILLNDRAEIENSTPFNNTNLPTYGPNVRNFTTNTVSTTTVPQNEIGEASMNLQPILPVQREEQNTISRIYEYEITTALYSSPNFRTLQDSELNIDDRFRPFHSADTINRNNVSRPSRR